MTSRSVLRCSGLFGVGLFALGVAIPPLGCSTKSDAGSESPAIVVPEGAEQRARAILETLQRMNSDEALNPERLKQAEAAWKARRTNNDARILLQAARQLAAMHTTGDFRDWQLPDGWDGFLQRNSDLDYLSSMAALPAPAGTSTSSLPSSVASRREALLRVPYTPKCAPPSCAEQTIQATAEALALSLTLTQALEAILGEHAGEMLQQCVFENKCSVTDLEDFVAKLALVTIAPELKAVMGIIGLVELLRDAYEYGKEVNQTCVDFQTTCAGQVPLLGTCRSQVDCDQGLVCWQSRCVQCLDGFMCAARGLGGQCSDGVCAGAPDGGTEAGSDGSTPSAFELLGISSCSGSGCSNEGVRIDLETGQELAAVPIGDASTGWTTLTPAYNPFTKELLMVQVSGSGPSSLVGLRADTATLGTQAPLSNSFFRFEFDPMSTSTEQGIFGIEPCDPSGTNWFSRIGLPSGAIARISAIGSNQVSFSSGIVGFDDQLDQMLFTRQPVSGQTSLVGASRSGDESVRMALSTSYILLEKHPTKRTMHGVTVCTPTSGTACSNYYATLNIDQPGSEVSLGVVGGDQYGFNGEPVGIDVERNQLLVQRVAGQGTQWSLVGIDLDTGAVTERFGLRGTFIHLRIVPRP